MLPVAFEASSVKTPHSGKSASGKQDSGSSAPFTEMIDHTASKPDTSGQAANPGAAKADGAAAQPRSTGHSLLSKSSSPPKSSTSTATLLSQGTISLSVADDAGGETHVPADQKGASKAAGNTVSNAVSITSADASAGLVKQDLMGDAATEFPANLAGVAGKHAKNETQVGPAKQSGAHGAKAACDKNLDGAAVIDQTGDGAESATAQTGTQPVATAVATIIDPAAAADAAANSAEPQDLFAASKSPITSTGKAAGASPDIASDQPGKEAQPLGEGAHPDSSALALANLDSDEAVELSPTLSALAQVAAAHGKGAQAGAPAKLSAPVGPQPGAGPEKPDAAVPSEDQGLLPPQVAAAPPATRAAQTAELDLQKASLPQTDSLPQDASAAQKNSHAVPSSALSLNGININIAAPATVQDPTAAAAVAASPQSAPAALVPVSGIAVEIASKALADKNRFEIRLDPPELGRIHVRLDVDSSGQITSHVVADRSDTLDLLRRDAPSLERALQDAGLKTSNNGLQFSLRDHGGFTRQDQPLPMPTNMRLIASDETLPAEISPLAYRPISGLRSGLDIRV